MQKYIQDHKIYSYECDKEGKLRLLTLFSLIFFAPSSYDYNQIFVKGFHCYS